MHACMLELASLTTQTMPRLQASFPRNGLRICKDPVIILVNGVVDCFFAGARPEARDPAAMSRQALTTLGIELYGTSKGTYKKVFWQISFARPSALPSMRPCAVRLTGAAHCCTESCVGVSAELQTGESIVPHQKLSSVTVIDDGARQELVSTTATRPDKLPVFPPSQAPT